MAKLKRERDNQQWILDYLVMTTGRDRNFGVEHQLWPTGVPRNHRMVPRVMAQRGAEIEALADASYEKGHRRTASRAYYQAVKAYKVAQHAIMADTPVKRHLYERLNFCYDRVAELSDYPLERVEVSWSGGAPFPALFHRVDDKPRPTAVHIPGMDATKEDVPDPNDNIFLERGMNVLVMDGPGQGESNVRGIRVTDDNYERAVSAAIDWLEANPYVAKLKIGVVGFSMGSFWAPRAAAFDDRVAALVAAMGCFMDKRYIFEMDSPHFKQQFMYMAGIEDEDEFDELAARMTLEGYGESITCPTLLCSGEFDPLSPLEDTYDFYDEIAGPKELWVVGDEAHRVHWVEALAGMSVWHWCIDWLSEVLESGISDEHDREIYIGKGGRGPFPDDAPAPDWRSWDNGVSI